MLTEYITIQGDRLDTIAFKAYGDTTLFGKIQEANPNIPSTDIFEGGVKILVPIIENTSTTNLDSLPPWKRVEPNLAKAQSEIVAQLSIPTSTGSFDGSFD